jgi:ERCC4-related helicase
MTPQTLFNDLVTESCDPRDIILIVIGVFGENESSCLTNDFPYCQTKHTKGLVVTHMPRLFVT